MNTKAQKIANEINAKIKDLDPTFAHIESVTVADDDETGDTTLDIAIFRTFTGADENAAYQSVQRVKAEFDSAGLALEPNGDGDGDGTVIECFIVRVKRTEMKVKLVKGNSVIYATLRKGEFKRYTKDGETVCDGEFQKLGGAPETRHGDYAAMKRLFHEFIGAKCVDGYTVEGAAAAALGRKGGSSTSPAKRSASRANGAKGGRPNEGVILARWDALREAHPDMIWDDIKTATVLSGGEVKTRYRVRCVCPESYATFGGDPGCIRLNECRVIVGGDTPSEGALLTLIGLQRKAAELERMDWTRLDALALAARKTLAKLRADYRATCDIANAPVTDEEWTRITSR